MQDINMMSPADIALQYDGDKRAIGRAVSNGTLDPTLAAMAGIFIDRTIASNIKKPNTTVFEDMYGSQEQATPYDRAETPSGGVASLPVDESMIPNEYAGGGIVAFANRGEVSLSDLVSQQQAADPYYEENAGESSDYGLDKYYRQIRALREGMPSEQRQAAKKFYESAEQRAKDAAETQKWTTGLLAAAKMMGTRGSFAQGLSAAGEAAAPGLQKAAEMRGAGEEARIKGLMGLEEKERAEMGEDVKAAETAAAKELERRLARDTDAKAAVNAYVASAKEEIAAGKRKPATDAQLRAEAWTTIRKETYGPRAEQAAASTSQANVANLRSKTDVEQAISADRKNMKSTIEMANVPIRPGMTQQMKDMIAKAKQDVAAMDARHNEMRRTAGIAVNPVGGQPSGVDRGSVDTKNPLLR